MVMADPLDLGHGKKGWLMVMANPSNLGHGKKYISLILLKDNLKISAFLLKLVHNYLVWHLAHKKNTFVKAFIGELVRVIRFEAYPFGRNLSECETGVFSTWHMSRKKILSWHSPYLQRYNIINNLVSYSTCYWVTVIMLLNQKFQISQKKKHEPF